MTPGAPRGGAARAGRPRAADRHAGRTGREPQPGAGGTRREDTGRTSGATREDKPGAGRTRGGHRGHPAG